MHVQAPDNGFIDLIYIQYSGIIYFKLLHFSTLQSCVLSNTGLLKHA